MRQVTTLFLAAFLPYLQRHLECGAGAHTALVQGRRMAGHFVLSPQLAQSQGDHPGASHASAIPVPIKEMANWIHCPSSWYTIIGEWTTRQAEEEDYLQLRSLQFADRLHHL